MFRSRITNVLIGCAVGLLFLLIGGENEWTLPLALAATVLVSSYLIHIQTFWRQAPITAAIVIATGLTRHSRLSGIEFGLHRVRGGPARLRHGAGGELGHVAPVAHAGGAGQIRVGASATKAFPPGGCCSSDRWPGRPVHRLVRAGRRSLLPGRTYDLSTHLGDITLETRHSIRRRDDRHVAIEAERRRR